MLKGIMTGISSATGIYIFSEQYLERFYIGGMQEVFGIEVTIASFFVLMALAGGISEVLQRVNSTFQYAYHTAKQNNKAKNGVETNGHNTKQNKSNTTVLRSTVREYKSNEPSEPSKSSEPSKPSMPSEPKQI